MAAAAVTECQQARRVRELNLSELLPPARKYVYRKFSRVSRLSNVHISTIVVDIITSIRNGASLRLGFKIMVVDHFGFQAPRLSGVLEIANQLLLFAIQTHHRPELLQCSDFEIVTTFGSELRGIVNYYSMAYDVARRFYPVKYMFMVSSARTLANKHKISRKSVYAKYKRTSEPGVKALIVEAPNPNHPEKPYYAILGDQPIRTSFTTAMQDRIETFYVNRNELVRRLLADTCELCGSKDGIAVHQIHKLADIKKHSQGRKSPPDWARFMLARNRKAVVVFHKCHSQIHAGRYDYTKVNQNKLESRVPRKRAHPVR